MALMEDNLNPMSQSTENVVDINLDGATRTRFRINGDPTAIIELNLSDLGIVERIEIGLDGIQKEVSKIASLDNEDESLSNKLKQADAEMRKHVDYIFDYPVSAACAKYGTMYDPKDGKFRYETIIDGLLKLYSDNIESEAKKVEARIKKYTSKYTAAKSRKK